MELRSEMSVIDLDGFQFRVMVEVAAANDMLFVWNIDVVVDYLITDKSVKTVICLKNPGLSLSL